MFDSVVLNRTQEWVDRLLAGDPAAPNELAKLAWPHMERLARRMIRGFGRVADKEATADILQMGLIRLWSQLENLNPPTARGFYNLASMQIRNTLIDLDRKFRGAVWQVRGLDNGGEGDARRALDPEAPPDDANDLLIDWGELHKSAEELPSMEREVFGLLFYHGLSQAEAAEVLGVSERTVKRYWKVARFSLSRRVKAGMSSAG